MCLLCAWKNVEWKVWWIPRNSFCSMINVTQVSKLKLCKLYCSKGSPSPWSSCGKFLFSRYVQCTTNFHSLCKTDANNQKVFIVNTWKERRCNNYVPLQFFEQISKLQVFHQYSACLQTYDSPTWCGMRSGCCCWCRRPCWRRPSWGCPCLRSPRSSYLGPWWSWSPDSWHEHTCTGWTVI